MADVGIVFQKMLVLLLMMSVGFAAGKLGVMTQQGNHCLSVLINKVTMPCLLLHASVSGERVLGNGDVLLLTGLYFAGFALLIALARLYRLALHPAKEDGGVYELLMIFPNSAFIGIPVAAAIYGSTAVFGISLLNLPFYVALYCYGVSLIQGVPMGKVDLKQIFSPLMITSILGLALYLCNIRLPDLLGRADADHRPDFNARRDDAHRLYAGGCAAQKSSMQLADASSGGGKAASCAGCGASGVLAFRKGRDAAGACDADCGDAVCLVCELACGRV